MPTNYLGLVLLMYVLQNKITIKTSNFAFFAGVIYSIVT